MRDSKGKNRVQYDRRARTMNFLGALKFFPEPVQLGIYLLPRSNADVDFKAGLAVLPAWPRDCIRPKNKMEKRAGNDIFPLMEKGLK